MASKKINGVYIKDNFILVGPKERAIKNFDLIMSDYYYGEKTFEQAEIKMQQVVINSLLNKNRLLHNDINFIIGGDLSNQVSVSSYAASKYNIPFLGVYSACASFCESLIFACELLENKKKERGIVVSSSHNLHAEKQFRFPIEYGAPKAKTSTFTTTASVATLLTNEITPIKIESYTIGKVIDMGISDVSNMGSIMAPAGVDTIMRHLNDLNRQPDYYDVILTGDLGIVGSKLLKIYLEKTANIKLKNQIDCGIDIYKDDNENVNSGASGPVVLPLYLFSKILKQKKYKKILIVGTGSLHSPLFVNQKLSIPAISHAVSLEVIS